jgi:heat-inducible transcriptional repressor
MAYLDQEGFIIRPHTSAGSIPSDKGYRHYVASLDPTALPLSEQRMIQHLFHQVEGRMDEWLSLAASIISRFSQNTAVITVPKPADCQVRHVELVSLQDFMALLILVLRGARIKQQLLTFENATTQDELMAVSNKLNQAYVGLTGPQIKAKGLKGSEFEQQLSDSLVKMMQTEDEQGFDQSYLEGLHFLLNQPEFAHNQRILDILEVLEHRTMLGAILPQKEDGKEVRVVIGSENKAEIARDCSLVIGQYGLPKEANGTIMVVGPTRMAYPRIISTVSYLAALLSGLVAELYGVDTFARFNKDSKN